MKMRRFRPLVAVLVAHIGQLCAPTLYVYYVYNQRISGRLNGALQFNRSTDEQAITCTLFKPCTNNVNLVPRSANRRKVFGSEHVVG